MHTPVALTLVALSGFFLVALGAAALLAPDRARRFLLGFAQSAARHYAELAIRLVVGAAFVLSAPRVGFPLLFEVFGWVLVATTAAMLLVPWKWHRQFAEAAVPRALRFIPVVGVVASVTGCGVLWIVLRVVLR